MKAKPQILEAIKDDDLSAPISTLIINEHSASLKTKTLEFPNETPPVKIVIARATNAIGAKRIKLYEAADDRIKKAQIEGVTLDPELIGFAYTTASVFAATLEVEGLPWPMSLEYYTYELPEEIAEAWYDAVMELNPHWNRRILDLLDAQKKATAFTFG